MTKKIKSQGLGVSTLFAALSVEIKLDLVGNVGLRQWYYLGDNRFVPDHEVDAPLNIRPTVTVYDPDTKRSYPPTITSVVWHIQYYNETSGQWAEKDITSSTTDADYSVSSNGTLTVSKNFRNGYCPTLRCTVTYRDDRSGENAKVEDSVALATDELNDSAYIINCYGLVNGNRGGNRIYWNPLSGSSSAQTLKAETSFAGDSVTNAVKYFWYYMCNTGTAQSPVWREKRVNDPDYPCLAYECATQPTGKGQGTDTIVIDADYEDEVIELHVRIATSWESGGVVHPASDATEPNVDFVYGRCTVRNYTGNLSCMPHTPNGDTARNSMEKHTFKALYKQQCMDVAENISNEHIYTEWKMQRMRQSGNTFVKDERTIGSGPTLTVDEKELIDNNALPVTIIPEGTMFSPLCAFTFVENGVTKIVAQDGNILLGRIIK